MTEKRTLTIFFNDGTNLSFAFPQQAEAHEVASRIEELFKHQHLKVQADGILFIFPLTSVKYVQANPSPPASLGENVIRGATIVS